MSGPAKTYGIHFVRIKFVRVNIHDPKTAALQTQWGFMTTPEFFLIDPQGRVLHHGAEDITFDGMGQVFNALGK